MEEACERQQRGQFIASESLQDLARGKYASTTAPRLRLVLCALFGCRKALKQEQDACLEALSLALRSFCQKSFFRLSKNNAPSSEPYRIY
jgi:hypothetical protein